MLGKCKTRSIDYEFCRTNFDDKKEIIDFINKHQDYRVYSIVVKETYLGVNGVIKTMKIEYLNKDKKSLFLHIIEEPEYIVFNEENGFGVIKQEDFEKGFIKNGN